MADEKKKKAAASTVDNIGRKKWDLEEYEKKIQRRMEEAEFEEREAKRRNKGELVVREPLRQRTYTVDVKKDLGKYQVVTSSTALAQRGGYYCDTCECLLKDSKTYLDHINGKKHQKKMGMNMRPERATLQSVRERLSSLKQKDDEAKAGVSGIKKRLAQFDADAKAKKRAKKEGGEEEEAVDEDSVHDDDSGSDSDDRRRRRARQNKEQAEREEKSAREGKSSTGSGDGYEAEEEYDALADDGVDMEAEIAKALAKEDAARAAGQLEKEEEEEDPGMAAMGFNFSFGGSKRN